MSDVDLDECFAKGLLRKDFKDMGKARRSLEIAADKIRLAKAELSADIFETATLNAYVAMFHAARALLFRDGITERSHWGLYVYIKSKYTDDLGPKLINELNMLRLERHDMLYDLEPPKISEEYAADFIKAAEEFINAVKSIITKNRTA